MLRVMTRTLAALAMAGLMGCVSGRVTKEEAVTDLKPRDPRPADARKRVAVVDLEDKTEYGKHKLGTAAADMLANYLVKSQQFRVFERQKISAALDEQKLGQSGIIDPATAARVGKGIQVEYVVYGAISNFGMRVESTNIILAHSKTLIAECTVDVRVINVETTEIVYSMDGRGRADRAATGMLGMGGSGSYDQTLAADSLRAAIAKMMDDLIDAIP